MHSHAERGNDQLLRFREQARSHREKLQRIKKACNRRPFSLPRLRLRLVRPRQEFVRLHLQQSAQGALELEGQASAGV